MELNQMTEWIEARICGPCKQGYTCDEFDCEQALKIAGILRKMVPFRGKDNQGKDVSGWFVPE